MTRQHARHCEDLVASLCLRPCESFSIPQLLLHRTIQRVARQDSFTWMSTVWPGAWRYISERTFCVGRMERSPQFIGVVSIRQFVLIKVNSKTKEAFKTNLTRSWLQRSLIQSASRPKIGPASGLFSTWFAKRTRTQSGSGAWPCPAWRGISRSTSEHQAVLNFSQYARQCEAAAAGFRDTAALRGVLRLAAFVGLRLNVWREPVSQTASSRAAAQSRRA